MNRDLFMAILSMDSYNRGYGISITGMGGRGSKLGTATIGEDATTALPPGVGLTDGFYAISYTLGSGIQDTPTGTRVVMYRGSDSFLFGATEGEGGDVINGYGVGAGSPYGPQARLAMRFYNAVTGRAPESFINSPYNVIVSGHSLGGGLAGLVGSLTGSQMVIFDPMPFDLATATAYAHASLGSVPLGDGSTRDFTVEEREFLTEIYGGTLGEGYSPWEPTKLGISGAYIPAAPGAPLSNLLDTSRLGGLMTSATQGLTSLTLPDEAVRGISLQNRVGQRHANTLIVIRMFADTLASDKQDWWSAAKYFLPALFNQTIGEATGAAEIDATEEDAAGAMQNAIAYSAIDEGYRPFGDTGIRAMFDDAADLGRAISAGIGGLPLPLQDDDTKSTLGKILVEYAGLLAVNQVFQNQLDVAVSGIMTYTPDVALTVDLTDKAWSLQGLLSSTHIVSVKSELVSSIMNSVDPAIEGQITTWLATTTSNRFTSVEQAVDGIVFFLGGGAAQVPGEAGRYRLAVTSNQGVNVPIEFGPAIVLGGDGVDTIIGGNGNDALFGGASFDTLIGRAGNDWFNGGSGSTVVWGDEQGGGGSGQDTVEYSPAPGTYKLTYEGRSASPYLSVVHNSGTDQLHDVEEVRLGTGQVVLSVNGRIDENSNLTIYSGTGGVQTILPKNFGNGITLINGGVPGQSYIRDRATEGEIRLVGFNTQIIGTDYDDGLYDYSTEEKVITAGEGNDVVEVGSGDAVIFGGEGYDQISGGDGDDIIIDVNSRSAIGFGSWGTDQGVINAGAGNDKILIGLPKDHYANGEYFDSPPFDPGVYHIDPGVGDDEVTLDFYHGIVRYDYQSGDGNDVITQLSDAEYVYSTSVIAFEGLHIYQPVISFNLIGYDESDFSVTWSQDEIYLISEDIPNRDTGNYWLQMGTVVVSFFDGGSITIKNVYGVVHSENVTYDVPPMGAGHGEPYIEFNGGAGNVPVTIIPGTSARAVDSAPQSPLSSPPETQSLLTGDQDISFTRGDHEYVGGSGNDRITISWDPNALLATLSGTTLTISDRWGIVGTTSVTDFDEIYVLAEDRIYTPQEFFDAFSNASEQDALGTENDDVLTGDGGANRLFGYEGDDVLSGLAGRDILDGGVGADEMLGGAGDDTYYVDDVGDLVIELANGGRDRVNSSIDFELSANVEDLNLTGTAVSGTGNEIANRITGNELDNTLSSGGGDDYLSGGEGWDTLDGGAGNDVLLGGGSGDTLTGGDGDDVLMGGEGWDYMAGGAGDDVYYADTDFDTIAEEENEGIDTVHATVDFALPDNVEILRLVDSDDPHSRPYFGSSNYMGGTVYGTQSDNELAGLEGADKLFGLGGNDYLYGAEAADELHGGAGDDQLEGGDGDDLLVGGAGADILDGGAGSDLLVGSGSATLANIGTYVARDIEDGAVIDRAVYYGPRTDYVITNLGNRWFKVENIAAAEPEIDYLVNVDEIEFYDPNSPDPDPEVFSLSGPYPVGDIGAQVLSEDVAFSITISNSWFEDPNGGMLTYAATLPDGSTLPSWLTFDGTSLAGTPPADYSGKFFVKLTAQGATGAVSKVVTLDFAPVNDAPTISSQAADQEFPSDQPFEFQFDYFHFDDVDGDALTLSAKLANGDPLPSWLSFDGSRFAGEPSLGFTGFVDIEVTASDGSLTASDSFRLTIGAEPGANEAPVIETPLANVVLSRGELITITPPSGTFSDPDDDALTHSAEMADGSALPAWLSFSGGHFTGTIPNGALGDYNIRITASDGSLSVSDVFTLNVEMLATGAELTPSQWALFGAENDRVVGRGAANGSISTLEGDDYITVDGWAMSVSAGDGNDIIEFMADSGSVEGGAGIDTFIFDGFSLVAGNSTVTWTTITDFQDGIDRIGIVNLTGGINGFSDLAPYMAQNGANVDIALKGLPVITIDNVLLADLDAADFMFGSWLTDGGFGTAPSAGSVPYPMTTVVKTFDQRDQLGNVSERVVANGTGAVTVDAMDGDDHITTDGWNNTIYGGRGNDVIEIFATNTTAMGGAGYDYYVFDTFMLDFDPWELTWATLTDYHDGADKIVFLNGMSGLNGFADLAPLMSQEGDDVRIAIADRPDIFIEDVALASLDASDFLFVNQPAVAKALRSNGAIRMGSTVGISTVTANGFSNVTVSGTLNGDVLNFSAVDLVNIVRVQGADGDDVITGNASANILWGGNGNDALYGGDGNDNLVGDAGDDLLSGGAGTDIINGGTNTDTVDYSYATANLTVSLAITAAQTVSVGDVDTITNVENLTGGAGNDTLTGTTTANTINGGLGDDVVNAGRGNDVINGGSGNDQAVFAGVSTTYSIATSGGVVSIVDNATSADGNDGTDVLIGIEQLLFKSGVTVNISSPIILDLDGGGVVTLSASESGSHFDMDGDGRGDDTSWMGTGEGMLFLDRDGNGTVSNAGEFSFINDLDGATSDLGGLRAFDSNGDGTLSSADARFADFKVWRDRDGDGVADQGEILSLAGAGVQSLGLAGTAVDGAAALGDVVTINKGSYTRTDGTSAEFLDAAFTYFSGGSQNGVSSPVRQQVSPFSRRQMEAFDRDGLRGGTHRELQVDWQYERDPITHWPQFGDQRVWSGPAVMAIDDLDQFIDPPTSTPSSASGIDRQLAMMVQEMSVFGARSAGEGLGALQRENTRPLDFFA